MAPLPFKSPAQKTRSISEAGFEFLLLNFDLVALQLRLKRTSLADT